MVETQIRECSLTPLCIGNLETNESFRKIEVRRKRKTMSLTLKLLPKTGPGMVIDFSSTMDRHPASHNAIELLYSPFSNRLRSPGVMMGIHGEPLLIWVKHKK